MDKLVACDFKKYDYLFGNREQMRSTLSVGLKTFNQWGLKGVAGKVHKALLDALVIVHVTKEVQRKQIIGGQNITEAQRLQRIDGGKTTRAETKEKLSKLIAKGYSIEEIATHYKMKIPSANAKLYRHFGTRHIDKIKEMI